MGGLVGHCGRDWIGSDWIGFCSAQSEGERGRDRETDERDVSQSLRCTTQLDTHDLSSEHE